MAWFLNYYQHDECDTEWTSEWSCACSGECPRCGAEIDAYDWDDLTVIIEHGHEGIGWLVLVSPPEAQHAPEYATTFFDHKEDADAFADGEEERIDY